MALIWFDSVNFYTTPTQIWTSASQTTVQGTGGRTGSQCLKITALGNAQKIFANSWTAGVVGAAFQTNAYGTTTQITEIVGFANSGSEFASIRMNSSGQIFVSKGSSGTQVGSLSTYQVPLNQYHYFEFQIDTVAQTATAYVDGTVVLTVSSAGFGSSFNSIIVGNNSLTGVTLLYNDIYFCDTSGGPPWNAPLGDVVCTTQVPSASGDFTQFAIKPGSSQPTNWQNVREVPPDGDTTYVYSANVGDRDSYIYPTYPPAGLAAISSIVGVMELAYCETDAGGSRAIGLVPRQAGTDSLGGNYVLGVNYAYVYRIMQTDVNGNNWTTGNLNATQFGVEVTI